MTSRQGPSDPQDAALRQKAAEIRLLILDVDGVLTDGGLFYGPTGEVMKRFDVKDGHALVLARKAGLPCALLTARTSEIVSHRAAELGLHPVLQGRKDKLEGFRELLAQTGIAPEACAYMGDDLNDLPVLRAVGLAACPSDAVPEVRACARFISRNPGGRGAVRELVELCLKSSERWPQTLA